MVITKGKNLMRMLLDAGYSRQDMFHHESDLWVFVTPLTTKIIDEWCAINNFHRAIHCPIFKDEITGKPMYDCAFQYSEAEEKWDKFSDIPVNPETECIEEQFEGFPVGTHREEIWLWFEENYDVRVYDLLYGG